MTKGQKLGLGLVAVIAVINLVSRGPHQPSGTTTSESAASTTHTAHIVATGGLACRQRKTYESHWKKVGSIMSGGGGHDSLAVWARRLPGCRTLDLEEGEPVERLELVSSNPQIAEVWLVGDTLPWFVHWAAIDTLQAGPAPETGSVRVAEQFEIEPASAKQLKLIQQVVEKGMSVDKAFAVHSQHHAQGYYVGAKIQGPGMGDGADAVWLISGEKSEPGVILSVNAVASEFSAPRLASKTKAGATVSDPEAEALLKHLRGK